MSNNLISFKLAKILVGIKEVFVYFDNSAISNKAQITITAMLHFVKDKKDIDKKDMKDLLNILENFNNDIQSAIDNTLMRSNEYYSIEQTKETEMICELFKARINTLIMMLKIKIQ